MTSGEYGDSGYKGQGIIW